MTMEKAAMLGELTIVVDVREVNGRKQTMSVYRVPKSGKVTFVNASRSGQLVVTPKYGEPFCEANGKKAKVMVGPGDSQTVHICDEFSEKEEEFLYTAEIKGADPVDPIVIIEK